MPYRMLKLMGVVLLSVVVFLFSFYGTNLLLCVLDPKFERILWVKIDPPETP